MTSAINRESGKLATSAQRNGSARAYGKARACGSRSGLVAIGLGALAMLAVALAPSEAAAAACALSIPKCGCTITSPGNYVLTGASPMKSTGTCVDITASRVTIAGAVEIQGPGSTTPTIGIHIEPTANKVLLQNIAFEDFGQGVRVDGPNASLLEITTIDNNKGMVVNGANAYIIGSTSVQDNLAGIQANSTATDLAMLEITVVQAAGTGIKLAGVNGAYLTDIIIVQCGTFGIWLQSASNNAVSGFETLSNSVAGVYLGCNAAGPNDTACPPGVSSSNGNSFTGNFFGSSSQSIVSNTAPPPAQRFGIAVGLGNRGNHFFGIEGSSNVDDDALDENPDCANNRWFDDTFGTVSPPKNTTPFCIN
jgi:hypothetical protein